MAESDDKIPAAVGSIDNDYMLKMFSRLTADTRCLGRNERGYDCPHGGGRFQPRLTVVPIEDIENGYCPVCRLHWYAAHTVAAAIYLASIAGKLPARPGPEKE